MANENSMQNPEAEGSDQDTDELLGDHPELAPDQSRISVEKVKDLKEESVRRLANTGDPIDEAADDDQTSRTRALNFNTNEDFQGNEARLPTHADFSRGSGWLGGKLWGEEALDLSSTENTPPEGAAPKGFDPSEKQRRTLDTIAKENEEGGDPDGGLSPAEKSREGITGDLRDQGRDLGPRQQATASQAFGRDVGASGLHGLEDSDEARAIIKRSAQRQNSDWAAVLGKLGGGSPGSEENLQVAEKFKAVVFPATQEDVLAKLAPGTAFRVKTVSIDLHEAVTHCRAQSFRNIYDVIDCVKEEIRRAEKREYHPA
ncbi:MAG: hypothetical protein JWP91_4595 [Fibrobacteres bacterium]|nr:hypothetical protein [Fibrobacterota bacterium]